jgi:hypothetical protein
MLRVRPTTQSVEISHEIFELIPEPRRPLPLGVERLPRQFVQNDEQAGLQGVLRSFRWGRVDRRVRF